jgi:hypothetical protein
MSLLVMTRRVAISKVVCIVEADEKLKGGDGPTPRPSGGVDAKLNPPARNARV